MRGEGKSMLGTWLVDESRIRLAAGRRREKETKNNTTEVEGEPVCLRKTEGKRAREGCCVYHEPLHVKYTILNNTSKRVFGLQPLHTLTICVTNHH